ncbi:MobF family relaxase [Lyngbya confervoides]|uniref:Relaxase domain-containing protein n=1 Tax=Lyngbya confervoides BDU141951 TaxID=1574623 RepID=A0ABD4T7C2_9CYAN|nr:MobF family relaxase [Lyngbya confervoides]MCM1984434.1 relaxase domain-containing protein [Lyngbya confervoides BDU141951]
MLETRNVRPAQASRYYSKDNFARAEALEDASLWMGIAAAYLGLSEDVNPNVLDAMLRGFSPDGQPLRFHEAHHTGLEIGALDCVFASPKSVSLIAVVQGDEAVLKGHKLAVTSALAIAEQRFAQTRIRSQGDRFLINTGNLAIAVFWHDTSREIDPHLHSHCLVMNCTYATQKGAWYSLDNRKIHDHKKWLGQLYQHELSVQMRSLGYVIEPNHQGQFEVKGFTPEQLAYFSRRSRQIQPLITDGSWRDRQRAGSFTRAPKGSPLDKRELLDFWERECHSIGIEFPEPKRSTAIAPSTIRFYGVDSTTSVEDQEQQLFLKTQATFRKIEEAIAVNLPVVPLLPPEPRSPLRQVRNLLTFNRVEEAIALLDQQGLVRVQDDPQTLLVRDWGNLSPEQRQQSVLLVPSPEQVIPEIRTELQRRGELGNIVLLNQAVAKPTSRLRIGDFVEPLRNYQRRGLERGQLYQVRSLYRNSLELESPIGDSITTRHDFQFQVVEARAYPVCEWEPLVWTYPDGKQDEFAILSLENASALIQYRDGDLAQVDISRPLPVQSAIARTALPPGKVGAAFVLCQDELNLKEVIQQCRSIRVYGKDVKSIIEATKTSIARHDSIYALRWAVERDLQQEQPLGTTRDFTSLSAFRAQHRHQTQPHGVDLAQLSRAVRRSGQWRSLQRDERLAGAIGHLLRSLQSKSAGVQQYRRAVDPVCASIGATINHQIAQQVSPYFRDRSITRTLAPSLAVATQSLQQYGKTLEAKRGAIASLALSVNAMSQQWDRRELLAIAQDFRRVLPQTKLAVQRAGGFEIETTSLVFRVEDDRFRILSKQDRSPLGWVNGEDVAIAQLSQTDYRITQNLLKLLTKETQQPSKRLRLGP